MRTRSTSPTRWSVRRAARAERRGGGRSGDLGRGDLAQHDKVDTTQKLGDYFRVPSVRHYLIVNTSRRTVVHHERIAGGTVQTRIATGDTLELHPPGLRLEVAALFADGA